MIIAATAVFAICHGQDKVQKPFRLPGDELSPLVYEIAEIGDTLNIRMKVNGVEGIFAIDTGSFAFLITPDFAKKAKLETDESEGKQLVQIPFDYGAVKLSAEAEVRPIGIKDDGSPGRLKIAGIIGLSALRNRCLGVDTVNHKVALWPSAQLTGEQRELYFSCVPYSIPNEGVYWAKPGPEFTFRRVRFRNPSGALIPKRSRLESGDSEEYDDHYRIACAMNGKPVSLALDTGSGVSLVRKSLTAWGPTFPLGETRAIGIDANWKGTVAIGDCLAFGEERIYAPRLMLVGDEFPIDGLVGYDALEGLRFLIQFNARAIDIARDPRVTSREGALLPFGIRFIGSNSKIYLGVVPGGAADVAGFRSGDELLSLGGEKPKVAQADASAGRVGVYASFAGAYPLTVEVEAKRGKDTIKRVLKRKPGALHQ